MSATVDRILAHVIRTEGGCWLWTGAVNNKGYAQVGDAGRTRSAHRVSYELHVGPIPGDRQIDHTCHNADLTCPGGTNCKHRRCVRPDHLEPVTGSVNHLRAARDRCPNGHVYTPENTLRRKDTGRRICATCRRANAKSRTKGYGKAGRPTNAERAARAKSGRDAA